MSMYSLIDIGPSSACILRIRAVPPAIATPLQRKNQRTQKNVSTNMPR